MPGADDGLVITPLYVLKKLEEHQKECARRWWAVMCAVIANLTAVIYGLIFHAH